MISFKKSYAEQMLQLALALSLLQVDPRDYLNQGWDSQLELRNGDGWQLEMLRAVPISEYPYANRKAIMPLIDDLVRFDRQNIQDITTYLLNVQNAQNNHTNVQDHENSISNSGGGGGAVAIEQSPNLNASSSNVHVNEVDIFFNSDHFEEETSIVDQNLADLGEYGDIPLSTVPYFGLPLKDEPPEDFSLPSLIVKQEMPSTSSAINLDSKSPSTSNSITFKNSDWSNVKNSSKDFTDDYEIKEGIKNIKIKKENGEEEEEPNDRIETLLSAAEVTKEVNF